MNSLTLDEMRDLAPGYVMGTLSADELAQFNATMADASICAKLEPELDAHRAAVEFLAQQEVVAPPADLRQRMLDRIGAERAAPQRLANTEEYGTLRKVEPFVERRAVRVTPQQAPHIVRTSSSRPAWVTAGVLGLAMAASAIFAVQLRDRVGDLESELTQQRLMSQRLGERLSDKEATVAALTNPESDLKVIQLVANEAAGPTMRVFWNQRTGEAVVYAANMAPLPKDRAYQLWVIRDGKPEPLEVFTTDADGRRLMNAVSMPRDPRGVVAIAVTEEPAGGSLQPTTTPFLVGQIKGD